MADVPSDLAEPAIAVLGAEIPRAGRWRIACALRGPGGCLFRQGVRRDLSWAPALAGRRARTRDRRVLAFRHVPALRPLPHCGDCLLYTSPSPRDGLLSRMPS